MASDQVVDARAIIRAMSEVKRRGAWHLIAELENLEPDLAEFVMEGVSAIHQHLMTLGISPRQMRKHNQQVQELIMVSITALRISHANLWSDLTPGNNLDPTPPPPPDAPPAPNVPPSTDSSSE